MTLHPLIWFFVAFVLFSMLAEFFTRERHERIIPEPWDLGAPSATESYLLMTKEAEEE